MLMFLFWIIGVLLIVIQTSLLPLYFSAAFTPDFIFIFVTFCAYRFSWVQGVILSFSFGWMMDVLTAVHLGFFPLEYLVIFSSLKLLTANSPVKAVVYQLPLVGFGYVLWKICSFVLHSLAHPEYFTDWSSQQLVYGPVLVLLAAIPCYSLFGIIYEKVEKLLTSKQPPRRRPRKLL